MRFYILTESYKKNILYITYMDTKNTKIPILWQLSTWEFAIWGAVNVATYEVHSNLSISERLRVRLLNHNHNLTLRPLENTKTTSNNSSKFFSYQDIITNRSVSTPPSYIISGIAVQSKDKINFNGSGYRTAIITDSEGRTIETTYKVYSKMQCELCKNGNIKIILDEENGETSTSKVDGQEVVFNDLYSSESNYCLKKIK